MSAITRSPRVGRLVSFGSAVGFAAAAGLLAAPLYAQDSGYQVGEHRPAPPAPVTRAPFPVSHRLARIEYVSGNVTFRANDAAKWNKIGNNAPLNEGAQLWATDGGRAEIRFDDGSLLRLGSNAVVTLRTVDVDARGEYTEVTMLSGLVTLEPREERSLFVVQAPSLTVRTTGPSRLRVGVGGDTEVGVSRGQANLDGPQGKLTLYTGDFVSQQPNDSAYSVRTLPAPDSWERWNDDRDRKLAADAHPAYHAHAHDRSNTSVFLSLGFPIGPFYRPAYRPYSGRGVYRHRW